MKKKYFYGCIHPVMVFMLLLLVPSLSFGQDVITSIPPLYSTNSVIREIGSGITLTYDEPPSFTTQKHRFIYNDENGITLVAEISNNYFINDMEIADGQVYFCGRKEGSVTQGMFGYFNINDVFFNNGIINCCVIPSPIPSYYWMNGQDFIQNLSRIELLKLSDGIHLFMIEHSGKNFFNTVMTSLSSECGAFSMLSAYQNVGVPMYKGFFKQHGPRPFTEIKGRIDMNEGMLYMMDYSFAMRIFRVRLMPSLPVPATSDLQLVSNIYHWQSLDVSLSPAPTQAVVSGAIQDHEKMFWRHDTYSTSECRTIQDIPLGTVTYKDIPFEIPQYRKDDIWNITSLSYEIHEASKIVICN